MFEPWTPPPTIISDNAVREGRSPKIDALGFKHYARALANAIAEHDEALTIGVFGEWGTGKTSLLRLIENHLTKHTTRQGDVLSVWFNAWRYEREGHPMIPLAECILSRLESREGRRFTDAFGRGERNRLKAGLRAILSSMSFTLGTPSSSPIQAKATLDGETLYRKWRTARRQSMLFATQYGDAFRCLDEVSLPSPKKIVVFVDDLDRCMPDRAVALLEGLKLAMARPGFIFVIAVCPRTIEDYLRHIYSDQYGVVDFNGREYLEKIIQLPFHLPDSEGRMDVFYASLLDAVPSEEHADFESIMPLIDRVCRSVPRAAIRFFNATALAGSIYASLAEREAERIPLVAFAVDRLLQLMWSGIYDVLVKNPYLCKEAGRDWGPDSLPSPDEGLQGHATFVRALREDRTLRDLLFSDPGRSWLQSDELRSVTSSFQDGAQERGDPLEDSRGHLFNTAGGRYRYRQLLRRIMTNAALTAPTLDEVSSFLAFGPDMKYRNLATSLWCDGFEEAFDDMDMKLDFRLFWEFVRGCAEMMLYGESADEPERARHVWGDFLDMLVETLAKAVPIRGASLPTTEQ